MKKVKLRFRSVNGMGKRLILILMVVVQTMSFSWDQFIQEDLRVAINRFSDSAVYFKGAGGDLYIEIGEGSAKKIYRVPEDEQAEIKIAGDKVNYRGVTSENIKVFKGDYSSVIMLSKDGKSFSPYRGDMEFIIYKGKVLPVNSVQSEEYIYSVVPSEIGSYFPQEAIKAQVLAARTYLYYNLSSYKYENFDLLDNVNSQMYLGKEREDQKINTLVNDTVGEIIIYNDKPINALYYSTSGGRTVNNEDVWGGAVVPYLRGFRDSADESRSPRLNWSVSISKQELSDKVGFRVDRVRVKKVASNRVHTIELSGSKRKTISGDELRRLVGYNKIFSTQFQVRDNGKNLTFTGKGSGHGVGMSQYGAYGLANSGKSYENIVKHYYKGVQIKKLKKD